METTAKRDSQLTLEYVLETKGDGCLALTVKGTAFQVRRYQ